MNQDISDALHGKYGPRIIRFRYDLLDRLDNKKGELTTVLSGEVSLNSLAQIKRTARFNLKDDGSINWLTDKIQPFVEVKVKGMWVPFSLGIFHLSTPRRKDQNKNVYREVEAYDGLVVLVDDKFDTRHTIPEGTRYYDAVVNILNSAGVTKFNIEQKEDVLSKTIEFEPGKEKLFAINELLRQINFTPIHVDSFGYYTASTYRSPSIRAADYVYRDNELSVLYNSMEEELDLFSVPNKWVVVRTNGEEEPLVSSYTNSNPNSLTSTANRGRTIVDYREIQDISNQESLDSYTERIAFEASQVYGKLTFETAIMPFHGYASVLEINYSPLGISGKYSETSWTIPLNIGGRMKHEVRAVVNI